MMNDGERRAARRWLRERNLVVKSIDRTRPHKYDETEFAIVEAWTDQAVTRAKQVLESPGLPYRVVGFETGTRSRGRQPGSPTSRWYIGEKIA